MIQYDYGDFHLGFIWQFSGSTIPLAAFFAVPSCLQAIMWRWLLTRWPDMLSSVGMLTPGIANSCLYAILGLLLGFRTNKAYARFWEGMTLVQQMRAEWFESCSNLMAFSNIPLTKEPGNEATKAKVMEFQYTLVRLMSLMHGAALRQIGGSCEEFDVLDVHGLDNTSMEYLNDFCSLHEINRVEVLLHWIQVLITDNIASGVLVVPPPILTRAYQTLSRGMVNLHDVRKLADIPFPFPLSQMIVVLIMVQCVMTPMLLAAVIDSVVSVPMVTFIPIFGMWSITFIAGQLEQPFGQDANDLPLSNLQFEMNNSLLMLLDESTQRSPRLKKSAIRSVEKLREHFGDPNSRTDSLASVYSSGTRRSSLRKMQLVFESKFSTSKGSVTLGEDVTKVSPSVDNPPPATAASQEVKKSPVGSPRSPSPLECATPASVVTKCQAAAEGSGGGVGEGQRPEPTGSTADTEPSLVTEETRNGDVRMLSSPSVKGGNIAGHSKVLFSSPEQELSNSIQSPERSERVLVSQKALTMVNGGSANDRLHAAATYGTGSSERWMPLPEPGRKVETESQSVFTTRQNFVMAPPAQLPVPNMEGPPPEPGDAQGEAGKERNMYQRRK
eukprot:TRINITY_DN3195_c1_g1_i1.p1 TRINITY_DN3195_c1_g1~~TRINITY_DN3195_c1_g1_i1.p1  ORF type:complete len:612 (+),score=96.95 TRINITY_DN3195_c1_g1_i1:109-1944(+)